MGCTLHASKLKNASGTQPVIKMIWVSWLCANLSARRSKRDSFKESPTKIDANTKCRRKDTDNQTAPVVSSLFVVCKSCGGKKQNCLSARMHLWSLLATLLAPLSRHTAPSVQLFLGENSPPQSVAHFQPSPTWQSVAHVGWGGGGGSTTCIPGADASRVTQTAAGAQNTCMRRLGNRRMHALLWWWRKRMQTQFQVRTPLAVEGCVSRGKDSDPHSGCNAFLENCQINYQTDVIANLLRVSFTLTGVWQICQHASLGNGIRDYIIYSSM
jgi:hypothetical protein